MPNTGTVLRGNNAKGDMVGKYFDPLNPNATHGFLLTVDGEFTSIDVPVGVAGTTVAHALKNAGQIVGFYDTLAAGPVAVSFRRNTVFCGTPMEPSPPLTRRARSTPMQQESPTANHRGRVLGRGSD